SPAWGVRLSVSLALLSSGVLSPGGTATVAVLVNEPVAAELIWATAEKVTEPPGSRVTVVRMLPVPLALATLEPGEASAVQLTAGRGEGDRALTCCATAMLGPPLLTTMVYVVLPPGVTEVTPSSLVMDRSDWGARLSVSVALLLVGLVSVTPGGVLTEAVLARVPVAEGPTWAVKVKVTLALTGRSTV